MKRGFTLVELLAILVILAIMILIALPSLTDMTKKTEENKSQEALNNIYMATENYIMANYDNSLDTVGGFTYVNIIRDLIGQNYIDINTLNPNTNLSFSSDDAVKITRNEDWTFSYELTTSKTLIGLLLEQYDSSNTTGLLKDSTNSNIYYFKGTNDEVSNNYLWYGGHQWRVVEFDTSENTLTLINAQPLTTIYANNSIWTTEQTYTNSFINSWLNDYFYNSLDSRIQNNIVNNDFNIGIYTDVDEITTTQKVGLLDNDQFTRAGGISSYLDIGDYWWLGNRYSSSYIRVVLTSLTYAPTTMRYGVRPVIKISDLVVVGGTGSLSSNYYTETKSTGTSDVQVGEYINIQYRGTDNACGSDNVCTFRVVGKYDDSIKIVLNGLLPTTSKYGSSATIGYDSTIISAVDTFANNIPIYYRHISSNHAFYIGDYPSTSSSYTVVQDEELYNAIGLPTIGEMFSGNDIDLSTSSSKTFVDVNTIENPTVSNYYWTMNRSTTSYALYINQTGSMSSASLTNSYGVRPVIFIKSGLIFTSGKGTANSPYELQ